MTLIIPQKYLRPDDSKMLTTRLELATMVNPEDTVYSSFTIFTCCSAVS
jgi:hypothetical protein